MSKNIYSVYLSGKHPTLCITGSKTYKEFKRKGEIRVPMFIYHIIDRVINRKVTPQCSCVDHG